MSGTALSDHVYSAWWLGFQVWPAKIRLDVRLAVKETVEVPDDHAEPIERIVRAVEKFGAVVAARNRVRRAADKVLEEYRAILGDSERIARVARLHTAYIVGANEQTINNRKGEVWLALWGTGSRYRSAWEATLVTGRLSDGSPVIGRASRYERAWNRLIRDAIAPVLNKGGVIASAYRAGLATGFLYYARGLRFM